MTTERILMLITITEITDQHVDRKTGALITEKKYMAQRIYPPADPGDGTPTGDGLTISAALENLAGYPNWLLN